MPAYRATLMMWMSWVNALQHDILDAMVPVNSAVVREKITLRQLAKLEKGDIIPVEMPETMVVTANGVPILPENWGAVRRQSGDQRFSARSNARRAPLQITL